MSSPHDEEQKKNKTVMPFKNKGGIPENYLDAPLLFLVLCGFFFMDKPLYKALTQDELLTPVKKHTEKIKGLCKQVCDLVRVRAPHDCVQVCKYIADMVGECRDAWEINKHAKGVLSTLIKHEFLFLDSDEKPCDVTSPFRGYTWSCHHVVVSKEHGIVFDPILGFWYGPDAIKMHTMYMVEKIPELKSENARLEAYKNKDFIRSDSLM